MLTNTSGIHNLTGYQAQLNISNTAKPSSHATGSPVSNRKNINDTVNISNKARDLQQVYQREKTEVEQNHTNATQQLEREYLQEKSRLEKEFSRKKQDLEINIYA
ncbi:hypothetical protein [Desulfobacula toluolica]|uniref:Uncharacterized protein n=1 Tax=Desulfobacula toluolica (strain DSM 7467 / Tol2) TaxID=651182 RepID=K0NBI1_DESTT|nr:hypothetical protein [Desulfobacula toluolica]CCK81669.1 uncharacterized protein TOL2_C35120 [Desulfobacula toluolica Tol2]